MASDNDKSRVAAATELRRQAEARFKTKAPELPPVRSSAEMQRLVHELEVHQIELEMQNEELSRARAEVEKALDNYTDLYDFAPVGYLTLDREGAIRAANLTAAGLLGVERSRLLGRRFGLFVAEESRLALSAFLEKVFASQGKQSCEVTLTSEGDSPLFAQIEAIALGSGQECRMAVIDISARRRAETRIQKYNEELQTINDELTRFNNASVERELRMIELKKEINELCAQSGQPSRYPLDFEKESDHGSQKENHQA
jgi:PAS domain S-box-containing protein